MEEKRTEARELSKHYMNDISDFQARGPTFSFAIKSTVHSRQLASRRLRPKVAKLPRGSRRVAEDCACVSCAEEAASPGPYRPPCPLRELTENEYSPPFA